MRTRIGNEENGAEKWQQFVTWLNTPPRTGVSSAVPRGPTKAEQIRAAARAQVGNQGAAFAAFAGPT